MPPTGAFPSAAVPSSSLFTGLVGPIVPGFFEVDQLSLAILLALAALAALLILCAPATGSFFRHLVMLVFFFIGAFGIVTARHVLVFFGAWEMRGRFPDLLDQPLDASLYELLEQRYREPPVRAVERLEPVVADADEAEALGVKEGAPLLLVERVAYSAEGVPLEYARDLFRGDRTRVLVESGLPAPEAGR